ncbi:hypothetical protein HC256_006349 [Beauveria bassiana]|nr:hypothetical protein HC256_006349 [Beauveria bassiana]
MVRLWQSRVCGNTCRVDCSARRSPLWTNAEQDSSRFAGLGHLAELDESRSVATLGSLLSAVRRLRRVRRGSTRGAVVTASLTLASVVGETKCVGGAWRRRASARTGTRTSLGAMRRDGPVTGAATESAGFLSPQGSNLRTGRTAVSLATTHIKIGGVGKSHLKIVDVAGDVGGHDVVSCRQCRERRGTQTGDDGRCVSGVD